MHFYASAERRLSCKASLMNKNQAENGKKSGREWNKGTTYALDRELSNLIKVDHFPDEDIGFKDDKN